jgi:CRP-like cAMP-binding protein
VSVRRTLRYVEPLNDARTQLADFFSTLLEVAYGLHPPPFTPQTFLTKAGIGKTSVKSPKKHIFNSQGDAADALFYIQGGRVKITVVSQQGKDAVIALLEQGSFG